MSQSDRDETRPLCSRLAVRTEYSGPFIEREYTAGPEPIRLVMPADPERLLDDPEVAELNRRDDYMPYWAYLWPAAYLIAEELILRDDIPRDWPALELGCGLGLSGLVAAKLGHPTLCTDQDATSLQLVERSAARSGIPAGRLTTQPLDYRDDPPGLFPLILGADLNYERRLIPLVIAMVARTLAPGGLAILADAYRSSLVILPETCQSHGLAIRTQPVSGLDLEGNRINGFLHEITWPQAPPRETWLGG